MKFARHLAIVSSATFFLLKIGRNGLFALAFFPMAQAVAGDLPQVTSDGLHLKEQDKLGAVWVKPGASLEAYNRVLLVDAYVAFAKDWQKDFNRDQRGVSGRVSDSDMQNIKEKVAEQFKSVFTKELEEGGYAIATEIGPDVMTLRPAIINLEVTAPDLPTAGMTRTIVSEAGELTLYMELYDSVTSAKFALVMDAEVAGDYGYGRVANRVTNRQALDDTLEYWADLLRKRLDEAHGK